MKERKPLPPRREPLARSALPPRRTRIRPMSAKRRGERDQRQQVVEQAMRRPGGTECKAKAIVPEVKCWGPLDPDEIVGRGVRPGSHLEADLVQMLCRAHHTWKHEHPAEAERRGLTVKSWNAR